MAVGLSASCGGRHIDFESDNAGGGDSNGNSNGNSGGNSGAGSMACLEGAGGPSSPLPACVPPPPALDLWIAFDSDRVELNRDVFVIRLSGRELRRLTQEPSTEMEPTFSNDGMRLAFASDREGGIFQIYVLDLVSKAVARVTNRAEGAREPAFSPDGASLAYRSGAAIYASRTDATEERLLEDGLDSPSGAVTFSTDGAWIAYDDRGAILATRIDGSESRVLVPPTAASASQAAISPDGFNLVLQASCEDNFFKSGILVVPFSGVATSPCTAGRRLSQYAWPSAHPAWGPEGLVLWDANGDIMLFKDPIVTWLTRDSSDDRNPAWSPLGTQIP